jgi:hypothetical protein
MCPCEQTATRRKLPRTLLNNPLLSRDPPFMYPHWPVSTVSRAVSTVSPRSRTPRSFSPALASKHSYLQAILAEQGLFWSLSPALASRCSVLGLIQSPPSLLVLASRLQAAASSASFNVSGAQRARETTCSVESQVPRPPVPSACLCLRARASRQPGAVPHDGLGEWTSLAGSLEPSWRPASPRAPPSRVAKDTHPKSPSFGLMRAVLHGKGRRY